jgi:putative transposase
VKVIGRLPGERTCLSLVWAVLDRASKGWRGVEMNPAAVRQLQNLRREMHAPPRHLDASDDGHAVAITAA